MKQVDCPVLIAGGGPVGMTLALNLARYGIASILVERNAETTRHPKMDLTNGRSMELYHRLGLTERLRDAGVPRQNAFDIAWFTQVTGSELHRFHYPSADEATWRIANENDGHHAREAGLRVSQIMIEPVLKKAIDESCLIDVRFGTRFDRIVDQDADGVEADIIDEATGVVTRVRCAFLAGCDGGGSRVRRQIDVELDGDMAVAGAYMVHFRTTDATAFKPWGPTWHFQNGSGTVIAQNDADIYTLQAWLIPGLGLEDRTPAEVLEGWVGRKFDYEILQANTWTANFVVAQKYRSGRVILAGDSAHQFIPTGGYGMNSGIADAAGLSWVLAASIQGWGGNQLLDAYETERRTVAWWHLRASERHMGVRMEIGELYAAAGMIDGDEPECVAARTELGRRIGDLGNAENESWGVELGYRYDDSPVIVHEAGLGVVDPLVYRPNTAPGARLPHVFLEPGISIHDRLGLYFTLVVLDDTDSSGFEEQAKAVGFPLAVLRLNRPDLKLILERNLLLIRPDQHVAWRSDIMPADPGSLLALVCGKDDARIPQKAADVRGKQSVVA